MGGDMPTSNQDRFGSYLALQGSNISIFHNAQMAECCDELAALIDSQKELASLPEWQQQIRTKARDAPRLAVSLQLQSFISEVPESREAVDEFSKLVGGGKASRVPSFGSDLSSFSRAGSSDHEAAVELSRDYSTGLLQTLHALNQLDMSRERCLHVISDDKEDIKQQYYFFDTGNERLFSGEVRFIFYDHDSGCLYQCLQIEGNNEHGLPEIQFNFDAPEAIVYRPTEIDASPSFTELAINIRQGAFLLSGLSAIATCKPLDSALKVVGTRASLSIAPLEEKSSEGIVSVRLRKSLELVMGGERDLDWINLHLLQAYFDMQGTREEFSKVLAGFREAYSYLSIALNVGLGNMLEMQFTQLNKLFVVAARVSTISCLAKDQRIISKSYNVYEILLVFMNQYVIGEHDSARPIGYSEDRKAEIISYILNLNSKDIESVLGNCWLAIYKTTDVFQQFKQPERFDLVRPDDVEFIVKSLRLVSMPFEYSKGLNDKLPQIIMPLNWQGLIRRLQPANQSTSDSFEESDHSFRTNDGTVINGVNLIPIDMPVLLLEEMSEQQAKQLTPWMTAIKEQSLWFKILGPIEIGMAELKLYREQEVDPAFLSSGQILFMLEEFFLDFDQSEQSFYDLLKNLLGVGSPGIAKVYWCYALIQVLMGSQNVIHVLPESYEERILDTCLDILFEIVQIHPGQAWCLTKEQCKDALPALQANNIPHYVFGLSIGFPQNLVSQGDNAITQGSKPLWNNAIVQDSQAFATWFLENCRDHYKDFFKNRQFAYGTPQITLGEYTTALGQCSQYVNQFIEKCLFPYSVSTIAAMQRDLANFFRAFMFYHFCSFCEVTDATFDGKTQEQVERKRLEAPFAHFCLEGAVGDPFAKNKKLALARFLEFLAHVNQYGLFGQCSSLSQFIEKLIQYLLPSDRNNHIPVIVAPNITPTAWMRYRDPDPYLSIVYLQLPRRQDFGNMIRVESPKGARKGVRTDYLRFLTLLSGLDPNLAGSCWHITSILAPIYLIIVVVVQALFLHTSILGNNSDNQIVKDYGLETALSDAAYISTLLAAIARLVQRCGCCIELVEKRVVQYIIASTIICLAVLGQTVGQIALTFNNSNAPELLIISDTTFFMMLVGSPIALANAFADLPCVFIAAAFFPVLLYKLIQDCCMRRLSSAQSQRRFRHFLYAINRLLFVATLVSCIVGICLCFPAFLENIVGNYFDLKYAQDLVSGAIASAFVTPGVVFLVIVMMSSRCLALCCKQKMHPLDWVELIGSVVVLAMIGLCIGEEVKFVQYQQSDDPLEQAQSEKNSTFVFQKTIAQVSGVGVAILAFISLAIVTALRNSSQVPMLGSVADPATVEALRNINCCALRRRVADEALLGASENEEDNDGYDFT